MDKSNISTSLRFEDGVELLDTIDKLRGLGIEEEIPLPQIIVVGQQSSGKSSVLEAISGIPFPTNDGLCTRFATEVVLRRAHNTKTEVRIVRGYPYVAEDPNANNISKFHSDVEAMSPIGIEKVPEVVAMAAKCLNLNNNKNFTKDFLRIEVSGPKQDHLTLVDLPGLFYYTKTGQDAAEPQLVKDLALRYMREKRSIILAVASAKTDYSTQEILQTLKDPKIDPLGTRTIGVITGVDQVERHSARESDYLALADNDTMPLVLGWHVLRNPSFTERQTGCDRDDLERQFFETKQPWASLDTHSRGASQLKAKLSKELMSHIGRELKGVVASLDKAIREQEQALKQCGEDRSTLQQMKSYLINIGEQYQTLVKDALEGPYDNLFFSRTGERLRADIRQRIESFATNMAKNGHRWEMVPDTPFVFAQGFGHPGQIGDQDGLSVPFPPFQVTRTQYMLKLSTLLTTHRTRQLQGTFDPLLVGPLFKDQSCKWKTFAEAFVHEVANKLSQFVQKVIEYLVNANRTRGMLWRRLKAALDDRERVMEARLKQILAPFEKALPMTCNPLLEKSLKGQKEGGSENDNGTQKSAGVSNGDEYACQQLMEHMQAYYNVALYTFVDNVTSLGVEMCLLDGLDKLFSPVTVLEMKDDEVLKLAAESEPDRVHRSTTQRKLEKLKAGREICQQWSQPDLEGTELTTATESKALPLQVPTFNSERSRPNTPFEQQDKSSSAESDARTNPSTQATTPESIGTAQAPKSTGKGTGIFGAVSPSGSSRNNASPSRAKAEPSSLFGGPRSTLTFEFAKMNVGESDQEQL